MCFLPRETLERLSIFHDMSCTPNIMSHGDIGKLSLSRLAISHTPPAPCTVCQDLAIEAYIFWAQLERAAQNGCKYCDMIMRTAHHFKLPSFVLSEDEAADFRQRRKIYSSAGNEVDVAAHVFPARQKESWKCLRLSLVSMVEQRGYAVSGAFVTRTISPVVQYYTPTGKLF
jgi:hypothetical protein